MIFAFSLSRACHAFMIFIFMRYARAILFTYTYVVFRCAKIYARYSRHFMPYARCHFHIIFKDIYKIYARRAAIFSQPPRFAIISALQEDDIFFATYADMRGKDIKDMICARDMPLAVYYIICDIFRLCYFDIIRWYFRRYAKSARHDILFFFFLFLVLLFRLLFFMRYAQKIFFPLYIRYGARYYCWYIYFYDDYYITLYVYAFAIFRAATPFLFLFAMICDIHFSSRYAAICHYYYYAKDMSDDICFSAFRDDLHFHIWEESIYYYIFFFPFFIFLFRYMILW